MQGHMLKLCVVVAVTAAAAKMVTATEVNEEEGHETGMAERVALLEQTSSRLLAVVEGDDMGQLARRVDALEREAAMVTLLNSRLKVLESEQQLLNQELVSVRRNARRWKREMEALKREMLKPAGTLTENKADPACCLSLNESMREAEEREHGVNISLYDLRLQLHNLSHDLHDLQERTRHQPLLLCPPSYTKVGGQCFHLLKGRMAWDDARKACGEQGAAVGGHGDLATPANLTTFRVYVEKLNTNSPYLWVGGVREADRWRWVSGSRGKDDLQDLLGLPWDIGEPDNTPDQRHLCIHSVGNIKFHDCTHTAILSAVCQVT